MHASELVRSFVKPRGRIDRYDFEQGFSLIRFSCGTIRTNGDPCGKLVNTVIPRFVAVSTVCPFDAFEGPNR